MCFFSTPKIPAPPTPAQFQPAQQPDHGNSNVQLDDQIKRRRAMAANAFTGALGLGSPSVTTTTLGG